MLQTLGDIQRWIYTTIGGVLSGFALNHDWGALLAILPLGVAFGAVHALTPGHSKTLLASYMIGSRLALMRGVAVSSVLAGTHVLSSVVIALFAAQIVTRTLAGAGRAPLIEDISRALLVLIGLWFFFRAIRGHTHSEGPERHGVAFGVIAGMIPCPLTLFVMLTALSRGVPAAGLAFAFSMFLGVALTLGTIAAITVLGRDMVTNVIARYGASVAVMGRVLDGIAGVLLLVFGLSELLR